MYYENKISSLWNANIIKNEESTYIFNFSPQIRDFIVSRIQNQNKFSAVLSNGMTCITLEEPLTKGSTTDTDRDTLSDSDEVNWNLITIENDEIKLPTLEVCMKQKKDM